MQFQRRNTSRNGGEKANAELDVIVQVSGRVGIFSSANEWHNKRTIAIYASAECVPTRSGHRGFPQGHAEGERWLGKHLRKGKIAILSSTAALL